MEQPKTAVNVLHITDCHLSSDRTTDLLGVNTFDSLQAVIADVNASEIKPDCILVTGDISQDGSVKAYEDMLAALSEFSCPIRWFSGNHDNREHMQQVVGATDYLDKSLSCEGWDLVLLDSLSPGNVHGELTAAELDVLREGIAKANDNNVLVCLHHHPVPIGAAWLDKIGLHNPEEFLGLIDASSQVKAVLWGHVHQAFDSLREGKRMLASPSTCIQFKTKSDAFGLDELAPGYRWLNLLPDGSIETQVKRAESFELTLDLKSNGY